MKELIIANNMVAIARGKKGKPFKKGKHAKQHVAASKSPGQKRSAMLRMIMPFLSRETGEKLAIAITGRDAKKFASLWDTVKKEIVGKLEAQKHQALASNPGRDFAYSLSPEDCDKLISTFKWVLSRLCTPEVEAVDPCPMEPGEPIAVDPANSPVSIDAYPQLAELCAQMLASTKQV